MEQNKNSRTVEESYKIIDEVLSKILEVDKTSENAYIEFGKVLNSAEKVKVKNKTKENNKKEEIRKIIKEKTGIELTENDMQKILKKDEKHIKELSIDLNMNQIERIFNETKVSKRSNGKPMMTPPAQTGIGNSPSESHLTTRGMHQKQVGDLAAEIAGALGLNVELARIGGKHHDDGHTNSGHTGERIATMIGKMNNCGYIVHNALSADMLVSENVVNKVIAALRNKEPNMTEDRKEQIAQELWCIFDIAISHNGEGKERIIHYNPEKTMQDIKNDKNKCYTEEGYDRKILSATKEGAIVAWADKLCYCRTDIQDGVNLGILKDFNDDYLKYIGILVAKRENPNLFRLAQKIFTQEENVERKLEEIQNKIKSAGIVISDPELIKQKTLKLMREKAGVNLDEYVDTIEKHEGIKQLSEEIMKATTECGRIYVGNIREERRAEKVVNMIKDVCVEDLISYSDEKQYVGISPAVAKAFFGIRSQNLDQIVKYTRRKFEKELLPQAEMRIHEDLKDALLKTGLIREYMSRREDDEFITEFELTDSEVNAREKYGISKELEIKSYKKLHKAERYVAPSKELSTVLKSPKKGETKYKYERKACHRFIKLFKEQPNRVEEMLQNALESGYDIARNDVEYALKDTKPAENEILGQEYYKKILQVKQEIQEKYPRGFVDEEEKKTYIKELSNRRKNKRDEILASAVALEYIAGMTDGTVLEAAKLKKYLTNEAIEEGYKREGEPEKQLADMQKFWNQREEANVKVANRIKKLLNLEKGEER